MKYFKEVVGFLFQNFALLENKTVKENLEIIKKSGRTDISDVYKRQPFSSSADV